MLPASARAGRPAAAIAASMRDGRRRRPALTYLTIHILAAVAEHEREAISERTKAALAAAKARGIRLGTRLTPPAR